MSTCSNCDLDEASSLPSSKSLSEDDLCTNFVVNYEGDNEQPTLNELELDLVSPTNDDPSRASLLSPLPKIRKERTWSLSKNLTSSKNENILRTKQRTIYIAGRPPWYDAHGQLVEPLLIGICGGSGSGKTTVSRKIIEALDVPWVTLLSLDSFYKVLNEEERKLAAVNQYNFDHPHSFDWPLLIETIQKLKEGKRVEVPIYNFATHSREKETNTMYGANVIICEGILLFSQKQVLDMLDMKIFIDTDSDIRLARRLKRDISERGRDLMSVIGMYNKFVKSSFEMFVLPTVIYADLIVPRGGENRVAINLIVQHVHNQLKVRGAKLRSQLAKATNGHKKPDQLNLLPSTPQIIGMHTFIRNKDTTRDDLIFYSKRLMRLLIEYALSFLPFKDVEVETPQGVFYPGKRCQYSNKVCGVSILRAGETMEQALCDVLKDAKIGKILIQTNLETSEPELYYLRLPKDIKDYKIILMDATVATGAAALMAIRVLLDHDVPEENIILCSLLMAETGVHSIAYAFKKVKIVTTAVDSELNSNFFISPGFGNFGDRFFGTQP